MHEGKRKMTFADLLSRARSAIKLLVGLHQYKGSAWRLQGYGSRLHNYLVHKGRQDASNGTACDTCRGVDIKNASTQTDSTNENIIAPCLHTTLASSAPLTERSMLLHHGAQLEDHEGIGSCEGVVPVCTFRCLSDNELKLQKVEDFRGICIQLNGPNGQERDLRAAQDTCAERNLITNKLAGELGLPIVPDRERLVFKTIEKGEVGAQGIVSIPIKTFCCGMDLKVKFYVLEELAGHQMILGIDLILELGHLEKKPCRQDPGAAN